MEYGGPILLTGQGAGGPQTAAAVASDLVRLGQGGRHAAFGWPTSRLKPCRAAPMEERRGGYYLRIVVPDEPGVLEGIAGAFARAGVSLANVIQHAELRDKDGSLPLALTMHRAREGDVHRAVASLAGGPLCTRPPVLLRIEA